MGVVPRMYGVVFSSLVAITGAPMPASADEESINTDRPDFVESSSVVGARVIQIETGVSLVRDSQSGGYTETFTVPTLLRVGIGHELELRLETDQRTVEYDHLKSGNETIHGYSDIAVGFKWGLRQAEGVGSGPSIATLIHADLDTGSARFRGDGIRPSVRVVAEWELPADMSIGVMPGAVWDKDERHRFVNGILAVTTGKQWTARFRTFLEAAGQQIARQDDGGCIVTFDTGATYLIDKDVQVDAAVSRAANTNTPAWAFGAGLSLRF